MGISFKALIVLGALALGFSIAGCEVKPSQSEAFPVSGETARVLTRLDQYLERNGSEVRFECQRAWMAEQTYCKVAIEEPISSRMSVEAIPHPFDAKKIFAIRIVGGSEAYLSSLYEGLDEFATTTEGSYKSGETVVRFDARKIKLEGEKITLRCTASRDAFIEHQCFVILSGELLK